MSAPPRRASLKAAPGYGHYQQRRRAEALEQQRSAREGKLQLARMLAVERQETPAAAAAAPAGSQQQQHAAADGARVEPDTGMAVDGVAEREGAARGGGSGGGGGAEWGAGVDSAAGLAGAELRAHYARQLMLPEWLTDVPPDLADSWLAVPRPEGRRCLVVAAHGSTSVRSRTGALLARFQSALPGGGRGGGGEFTVVDAVLAEPPDTGFAQEQEQQAAQAAQAGEEGPQQGQQRHHGLPLGSVLWLADVVAWNGVELDGCSAECRVFWLAGRLAEVGGGGGGGARGGGCPELRTLPAVPATPEGLEAAARGECSGRGLGFVQDGLWLLHREGRYTPGATPLALLWKDDGCSRYLLDTDADGIVPERTAVVLRYRGDGSVATDDAPPVALGQLPPDFISHMGPKLLRPGRLLRFSVGPGGVAFDGGRPAGADLSYEGPANQRRGRADGLSKLLFQVLARAGAAPGLEQLQAAAAGGAGGGGGDGGGGGGGGMDDA
ncbi:MAG: hypothetical protein J3K34DRAFT_521574 [Monoraphidium minutum]|nr:MAG: hypothetical protein J3K34DRAFT_521574 [Monoraphidium minutum]